ncbi:MAG: hypothetical protein IT493_06165 [Gammaproteobacteria bacterium]|nr:hypothetical protein [Gammaproteobacteria bacterium]
MKDNRKDDGGRGRNQGEGDKVSARRYNEAQKAFVQSSRGREAIADAGDLDATQAQEGEQAEAAGRARARGEDPAIRQRKDGDGRR